MEKKFSYDYAFSRNVGWITKNEQQMLRYKRIAIAGLGGCGGHYLHTLTRLGVEKFNIADFDVFDAVNFNRQFGSSLTTLGSPKLDVVRDLVLDINPNMEINTYPEGINQTNLNSFLQDVDVVLDAIDIFSLSERRMLYQKCQELKIPVLFAAPLGMSACYLAFRPGDMTFEEYMDFTDKSSEDDLIKFLIGISPKATHLPYLVDKGAVDLDQKKGPSTGLACQLCAGIVCAQVVKLIFNRGTVRSAPYYYQFDAYRNILKKGWIPFGNKNLLQKMRFYLIKKIKANIDKSNKAKIVEYQAKSTIEKILDQARWAPSADNQQPWRFEIINETQTKIHILDDSDINVYNRNKHILYLSLGALIETIKIVASKYAMELDWVINDVADYITVNFRQKSEEIELLCPFVKMRTVDRKLYRLKELEDNHRKSLLNCVDPELKLTFYETPQQRMQIALINQKITKTRMLLDEAYQVNREILTYHEEFSNDKMPLKTLPFDIITRQMLKLALSNQSLFKIMCSLGGTLIPRFEMDILPAYFSSAFFTLEFSNTKLSKTKIEDIICAGQNFQRFWLNITRHGMVLQPTYATILFADYLQNNISFTSNVKVLNYLEKTKSQVDELFDLNKVVMLGRIGYPRDVTCHSRSTRLSLEQLMKLKHE